LSTSGIPASACQWTLARWAAGRPLPALV
jgi:hypothetical protein